MVGSHAFWRKQSFLSSFHQNQSRRCRCVVSGETDCKGHVTRDNFSCNLSRNDDDWKTLQVAERVSHVRNISSQLAMPPLEIVYNSFSASLKSPASKRRALIAWFSQNCVKGCDGHVTRSNLSLNVAKSWGYFYFSCNSQRNILLPLQGVLHVKSFLQLVSQRLLRDKLQEKLPRVTWP